MVTLDSVWISCMCSVVCLILFKFKISVSPKVEKSGNVLAALEIEVLPDWSNFLA